MVTRNDSCNKALLMSINMRKTVCLFVYVFLLSCQTESHRFHQIDEECQAPYKQTKIYIKRIQENKENISKINLKQEVYELLSSKHAQDKLTELFRSEVYFKSLLRKNEQNKTVCQINMDFTYVDDSELQSFIGFVYEQQLDKSWILKQMII